MRSDLVDRPLEDRHRRAEELIDWRSDHDDQLGGPRDHFRVRRQLEAARGQEVAQQDVSAGLEERHLAAGDPVEGGAIGVVDPDAEPGLGEHETQWEADVSATSEDDDVEFLVSHRGDSSRADAVLPLPEGPKPFG